MTQDNPTIKNILQKTGIETLNDMQQAALTASQTANNLVLLSPTGSGKTLAFLIPVVLGLDPEKKGIQTLILAPSRELALQIEKVFKSMSTGFKVNCFYGGHDVLTEINNLQEAPAVLIGTAGRLAEHIRKENFDTVTITTLVLDEFDKALEFGFEADMTFIIEKLPAIEKRILTSATQTIDIPEFTGIKDPVELNYLTDELVEGLSLKVVHSDSKDKTDTLLKLIGQIGSEPVLVFCNHRETVEQIGKFLNKSGVIHDVYHGKLEQFEREISLVKFRNGSNNILITTDLASRGLDIDAMKNVVHFHIPTTEAAFIHRNGRTARMHTEGNAYMILSEEEYLPGYITTAPDVVEMPTHIKFPASPAWGTIHVTGGKKEKINKVDLVGLFLKKGNLPKEQLGKIEVGDHHSYVAVKKDRARPMMQLLGQEKIKGYKIKMELV